jgi:hypothetical protein
MLVPSQSIPHAHRPAPPPPHSLPIKHMPSMRHAQSMLCLQQLKRARQAKQLQAQRLAQLAGAPHSVLPFM